MTCNFQALAQLSAPHTSVPVRWTQESLCWRKSISHRTIKPQTRVPTPLTSGPKPETPDVFFHKPCRTSDLGPALLPQPDSLKLEITRQPEAVAPAPHTPHPQTPQRGSAGGGCRACGGGAEQHQHRRQFREWDRRRVGGEGAFGSAAWGT